jgi:hypothetical protein
VVVLVIVMEKVLVEVPGTIVVTVCVLVVGWVVVCVCVSIRVVDWVTVVG